jgi:hypothetical protein
MALNLGLEVAAHGNFVSNPCLLLRTLDWKQTRNDKFEGGKKYVTV